MTAHTADGPTPEETSPDPLAQDEAVTLEAELRQALQHQRAAFEQAEETREEMRQLMERARDLLKRTRSKVADADAPGVTSEGEPSDGS